MAEKKRLSVAEMLAAARAQTADASSVAPDAVVPVLVAESAPPEPAESAAAEVPVVAQPPKAITAKSAGTGGRPSVADIMAAARANKAAAAVDGTAAAKKPVVKKAVAAKPATPKVAAVKTVVSKPAQPRDSASILAAARAGLKPGPISKADAPSRPVARPMLAKASPVARVAPPMPTRPIKSELKKAAVGVEDRRGFIELALGSFMAIGFTALSVTGGLFTLGFARFMFPNVLAEPPSRFKVGAKEGFPSGKVETKFVAQFGVWVVNSEFQGQQQIYALKTVCTHLGCTPNWLEAEQKFKCPCHGSGFYKDGVNFEGPAPRPLERYAVRLADDGQLEIDKSKTFHEELGQWADAESYIPV